MTKSNSSESPQTNEITKAPKRLLDGIGSPADIKALREQDLPQLAQEVRDELIKVLSQTGGHLGPNLGVVELTIAMHRVFDTVYWGVGIDHSSTNASLRAIVSAVNRGLRAQVGERATALSS